MILWITGFLLGCSPECREPSLEIGTGRADFNALNGRDLNLVRGAQGGTHVELGARVCGLDSVSTIDLMVTPLSGDMEPFEQEIVRPAETSGSGCCADFSELRAFVPLSFRNSMARLELVARSPGGATARSEVDVFVADPTLPQDGFLHVSSLCHDGQTSSGWYFYASVYDYADVMLATVWDLDNNWIEEHTGDWDRSPLTFDGHGEAFRLTLLRANADAFEPNVNTTLDCDKDIDAVVTAFRYYHDGVLAGCRVIGESVYAMEQAINSPDMGPNGVSRPEELSSCELIFPYEY